LHKHNSSESNASGNSILQCSTARQNSSRKNIHTSAHSIPTADDNAKLVRTSKENKLASDYPNIGTYIRFDVKPLRMQIIPSFIKFHHKINRSMYPFQLLIILPKRPSMADNLRPQTDSKDIQNTLIFTAVDFLKCKN
jgi:hypothetical protein